MSLPIKEVVDLYYLCSENKGSGQMCGYRMCKRYDAAHLLALMFPATPFRTLYATEAYNLSLVVRKPVFGVSDQVPHKPGSTTTQDG